MAGLGWKNSFLLLFAFPRSSTLSLFFLVFWLGAWLVNIFVPMVLPLTVWMFIEIIGTGLDPSGGFSNVGGTMGTPYCVVPVGADITLLDLLLPVVDGDLLLQLPALLLQLGACRLRHLGVSVCDEFASYDKYSRSRFEMSRLRD